MCVRLYASLIIYLPHIVCVFINFHRKVRPMLGSFIQFWIWCIQFEFCGKIFKWFSLRSILIFEINFSPHWKKTLRKMENKMIERKMDRNSDLVSCIHNIICLSVACRFFYLIKRNQTEAYEFQCWQTLLFNHLLFLDTPWMMRCHLPRSSTKDQLNPIISRRHRMAADACVRMGTSATSLPWTISVHFKYTY